MLLTGSSSNSSNTSAANDSGNNTSNTMSRATSSGGSQLVTSSTLCPEIPATMQSRIAPGGAWDVASSSAPPSCGSGGSVDDEWSRQMDELDHMRPSTAEPAASSIGLGSGRSVIDFFSDLPDVVIDDDPIPVDHTAESSEVSNN